MDYPSFNDESDKLLLAGLIGRQEEGGGGECLGLEETPRRRLLMSLQDAISYFTVSDSISTGHHIGNMVISYLIITFKDEW